MRFAVLLATVVSLAQVVEGHPGQRVWLAAQGGRITTHASDNDLSPTAFAPARVFPLVWEEFVPGIYTTDFPGYEAMPGGGVPLGTSFGFNIVGPLLRFDWAAGFFRAAAPSRAALSAGPTIRVSGQDTVQGFDFFTHNAPGDHGHLFYTLFGDGASASDGSDGVYALPLELTSTGLEKSPVYYLMLGKDVALAAAEFDSALTAAAPLLDERVDVSDYLAIDRGRAMRLPGYLNGDLDRSGGIDAQDYAVLDRAFLSQRQAGPVPTAAAPVPEPGGLCLALAAGAILLRRRKGILPA